MELELELELELPNALMLQMPNLEREKINVTKVVFSWPIGLEIVNCNAACLDHEWIDIGSIVQPV